MVLNMETQSNCVDQYHVDIYSLRRNFHSLAPNPDLYEQQDLGWKPLGVETELPKLLWMTMTWMNGNLHRYYSVALL